MFLEQLTDRSDNEGADQERAHAMICKVKIIFLVCFLMIGLTISPGSAEIYKYQDKTGKISYTSESGNIPDDAKILKVYSTEPGESESVPEPADFQKQESLQEEANTKVLQTILHLYQATHSYSKKDFFVCADMALDVWNMVKTKGIDSRIAIGNVTKFDAGWREYNHAWVVAETAPGKWLALETTGGQIVKREEANRNYYRGYFFPTPREFKAYVDLRKEAKELAIRTRGFQEQFKEVKENYDEAFARYNQLLSEYDHECADKRLPQAQFKRCLSLRDLVAKEAIKVKEIEGRGKQLMGIIEANFKELSSLERQLDQSVQTITIN
jgi:hypothetical protein